MEKGFRYFYDKSYDYIYAEQLKFYNYNVHEATNRTKALLRMYANLFTRDLRKVLLNENSNCNYCKTKDKLTLDHVIPITKGGKNKIENIQILCSICNLKKGNK